MGFNDLSDLLVFAPGRVQDARPLPAHTPKHALEGITNPIAWQSVVRCVGASDAQKGQGIFRGSNGDLVAGGFQRPDQWNTAAGVAQAPIKDTE